MQPKKSNFWSCLGIGCLFFIIAGGIGGYYLYLRITQAARDFAAEGIVVIAKEAGKSMKLPEEEMKEVMKPVNQFSQKVKTGEIGLEKAAKIGQALFKGAIPTLFLVKTFETLYLSKFKLSEETRKQSHIILARYATGTLEKKIDESFHQQIAEILAEKKSGSGGKTKMELKEKLTSEEMKKCLSLMRDAANKANIPKEVSEVNLGVELQKALDLGLKDSI